MLNILIADDSRSMRELLGHYLKDHGQVDSAVNGAEAVELFKRSMEAGPRYDLVLLDVMMPEMDGLEAARHITAMQAHLDGYERARLMVLSCLDDMEHITKAHYEVGVDIYLTKPFDLSNLLEAMANLGLIEQPELGEPNFGEAD